MGLCFPVWGVCLPDERYLHLFFREMLYFQEKLVELFDVRVFGRGLRYQRRQTRDRRRFKQAAQR